MTLNLNIKESGSKDVLQFDIDGVRMSLVNALRRIMISEVNTVAFETSDFENSSIKITENTSQFHNEFLLHRIGLIPINIPDTENFNESDYTFSLDVENKTNNVLYVTAGDIKVMNNLTGVEEPTEKFFPKDPISNENIMIVRLLPNPAGNSEKLSFTGTARIGNGGDDARYAPVSVCFYTNTIDQDAMNEAYTKYREGNESVDAEKLKKRFAINESERHFVKDAEGDPSKFSFTVESIGMIPPEQILGRAIDILNGKLEKLQAELTKKDSEYLEIEETPTAMESFDITIDNESHTLGFVIQEHANQLISSNDLVYVGYMNPHPLKKNIKLRMALTQNNRDNVVKQVTFVCQNIVNQCNSIKSLVEQKFGSIGATANARPTGADASTKPKKKIRIKKKEPETAAGEEAEAGEETGTGEEAVAAGEEAGAATETGSGEEGVDMEGGEYVEMTDNDSDLE